MIVLATFIQPRITMRWVKIHKYDSDVAFRMPGSKLAMDVPLRLDFHCLSSVYLNDY